MLSVIYAEYRKQAHYGECHYGECHYAECYYAECHYAECHGTYNACFAQIQLVILTLKANLVAVTHVYSNRYLDC